MGRDKELINSARVMINSYLIFKNDIKNIDLEIEEIQNNYEISAIQYKESTGKTNLINKQVENRIAEKESRIKYLSLLREQNRIKCEKIENAVNILKDFERDVIRTKYMQSVVSWEYVARKLGFTKIACKRAEERAIIKMIPLLFRYT